MMNSGENSTIWVSPSPKFIMGGVIEFLLVGATHDELRRGGDPNRGVLAGLPVPRCVLLPHEPAGLMLKPVQGPRQDRPPFVPDYLLVMQEPDAQQPVENFAGVLRGVPHRSGERRGGKECRSAG